jgi:hypothetical protein
MNDSKRDYISKALKMADELLVLANDEAALADKNGCGALSGVLRDCSYKIRQAAENAAGNGNKKWSKPVEPILVIFAAAALSFALALPANATIILSTGANETLGGLTFSKGALAEYDAPSDTAALYIDGGLFGGPADIDAVHVLGSGNIVLSTVGSATLGGLSFGKGDLIEYNLLTDTATLYLDETLFSGVQPNIDAAYINGSSNIILSTTGNVTLGGLSFSKEDLIEYNPGTDTATLYLDGSLFSSGTPDIDAVHELANGNLILSSDGATTLGGLSFGTGDLVEYNLGIDTATLYFAETNFSTAADIDAAYISAPEPGTVALLGLGSLVFVLRKRR